MKKKQKLKGSTALSTLRRQFPQVKKVVDAKRSISISVAPQDAASGRRKDPKNCALVRACVRQKIADAAIVGISYSYLINGNKATRYTTSTAVGREITSFDRHQEFAAGANYKLSKVAPSNTLGSRSHSHSGRGPHLKTRVQPHTVHRTSNIRVIKGA